MIAPAAFSLAAGIVALALWFGGLAGLTYLALYLLALAPGLPLGWRLFGRRHPAGWVAGALMGHGLSALAFWLPLAAGAGSPWSFGAAWLATMAAAHLAARRIPGPLVDLPPPGGRDLLSWLLILHLVLACLALPFGRLGERDDTGARRYRAYFTADFIWHMALTQEVARLDSPPRNPYRAPEPIHYYWTYFLVPAVAGGPPASPVAPVETTLRITATGTALLMFSLVFFTALAACGRAGPAAAASVLALVAASFEGTYAVADLLRRGAPLDGLRDLNIDAVSNWVFRGLRVDGLTRSMWYTPQHSLSFALGLVGVLAALRPSPRAPAAAALLTGTALALAVAMNPFLGAAFALIYGGTIAVDVATRRAAPRTLAAHALAAVPVALAIGWTSLNQMSAGAGDAVTFGWLHDIRSPLLTLGLSLGGLLLPAALGVWPWRGLPFRPVLPAVIGTALGLVLMHFVSLTDRSWVGFRAGNVLQVTLPMLAARGIAGLASHAGRLAAGVFVAALLAAGGATTAIDTWNAQDVDNRRMGPGFLWTLPISPAQQAGLDWVRQLTPPGAIVQADPVVRGRQNWSLIPSFAGRRMAAGQPISLLPDPAYQVLSERVHALVTALPPDEAHREAKALGIDYLWVDQDDRAAGPAAPPERFAAHPDLFTPVFRRGDVLVIQVR